MDEWVNILFIVVVGVLYAVGALIKGAGAKGQRGEKQRQSKQQRETWQQRLAKKAEEMQRAAEARTRQAAKHMRRLDEKAGQQRAQHMGTATRPTPPAQGRVAVRPGRGGDSVIVYEPGTPEPASKRQRLSAQQYRAREATERRSTQQSQPAREPKRAAETSGMGPIIESIPDIGLEPARPRTRDKGKPTRVSVFSVIDYADPDALRKAILHYEILGKPMALRDPFERTISL